MSVQIENAIKRYDQFAAVDGISLDIADGEFFVVLGPSGCGKSTLLRLIAGLDTLDAGQITLDGQQVSGPNHHTPAEDRQVGFVFQSYALWPHMNVRDNVAFPIETAGERRASARRQADTHLSTVSLAPYADRLPAALSGGQRQRVALARCLASRARTVLMDEPLANLDPHLRHRMEEELAQFHAKSGVTTVYITHDQREAMALATRIAVMDAGRFQQVGTPIDIHDRPATEQVARFIGRSAIVPADVHDGMAWIAGQQVPLPDQRGLNGAHRIVLRPADVVLGDAATGNGGTPAQITQAFYRGGQFEALAALDGVAEPLPVTHPRPLRVGETVPITLCRGWALAEAAAKSARRAA